MKTDVSRLFVTIISGAALLGLQATAVGTAGARSSHETAASAGYVHQAELSLGSSAAAHDDLGNSVALSADGHIALVGAPGRKVNGADEAGAAEVFRFQGGVWGRPVQLDLGTAASRGAGESVALSGDGTTAVLSAGRVVEVFRFARGSWNGPHELDLSAGVYPYGKSVGVSANGTAVVAGVQNGKSSAAEVFRFANGAWSGPQELSLGNAGKSGDWFGFSVAMSGDGNTVLVGSPNRKVQGKPYAGAAYAFRFGAGHWSGPTALTLGSKAAKNDSLGISVALGADGKTAVAGAPNRAIGSHLWPGAAEVFVYRSGTWSRAQELSLKQKISFSCKLGPENELGWSVAASTHGGTVLAGAPRLCLSPSRQPGGGELFKRTGSRWSTPQELTWRPGYAEELGTSSALSADGATALLGAPARRVGGHWRSGAAEVFR